MFGRKRLGRQAKVEVLYKMGLAIMEPVESRMLLTVMPGLEEVIAPGIAGPAAQERMMYWTDGQWRPFTLQEADGVSVVDAKLPDGSVIHFKLKALPPGQTRTADSEPATVTEEEQVTDTPANPFNTKFTIVLDDGTAESSADPQAFTRQEVGDEEYVEYTHCFAVEGEHAGALTVTDADGTTGTIDFTIGTQAAGDDSQLLSAEDTCEGSFPVSAQVSLNYGRSGVFGADVIDGVLYVGYNATTGDACDVGFIQFCCDENVSYPNNYTQVGYDEGDVYHGFGERYCDDGPGGDGWYPSYRLGDFVSMADRPTALAGVVTHIDTYLIDNYTVIASFHWTRSFVNGIGVYGGGTFDLYPNQTYAPWTDEQFLVGYSDDGLSQEVYCNNPIYIL
jgi:hypothetical protein